MNIILFICSFLTGTLGIIGVCTIYKSLIRRKTEGKLLYGIHISCKEIFGKPIRYAAEVVYIINHDIYKRKIITTDKNIKKHKVNTPILLLYIEKNNKIYWAEEKSLESTVVIILLSAISIFAFVLAFIALINS